ncbi:MAG TPA: hypothetical protein VMT56_04215 [Candidatus Bathyarchaeia archaeon]|nr:hypothetical protein [Candidatus Bathyarchaeia archaeon]
MGIGLVGVVAGLMDDGYTVQRVSGTLAGGVVGSIVAAAWKVSGWPGILLASPTCAL